MKTEGGSAQNTYYTHYIYSTTFSQHKYCKHCIDDSITNMYTITDGINKA